MLKLGLLGEKLGHSFSPLIHNYIGNMDYSLFEVPLQNIDNFFEKADFDGINVTIPYKKKVFDYCNNVSLEAQKIGAINTIVKKADGLYGYNTDYFGFLYMVKKSGVDIKGKKALVLGTGGASLTVQCALKDLGVGEIILVSRKGENNYDNISKHYDSQIIVNTTPVGMYPNNMECLVDVKNFKNLVCVYDLIYNPLMTKILLDAKKNNIKYQNGLSMLVAQAVKASEFFNNTTYDEQIIEDILKKIENQLKNIVLIGMPGCGKTTVGEGLSKILKREIIDTDALISKIAGKSISDIFAQDGEEKFREYETQAVAQATKLTGKIIACGGGVVTKERNYDYLAQNGTIFYLKRNLKDLVTSDRPLSKSKGVEQLAKERLGLYEAWCDYDVENCGIKGTITKIKELLQ